MRHRIFLLAVLAGLWASGRAAAASDKDALLSLERNPSPAATDRIGELYRKSKNPYARLWLMDLLYARVCRHQDSKAFSLLLEASKDRDPAVRKKAIGDLESFKFLPNSEAQGLWMRRINEVVKASRDDSSDEIQSVGKELGAAAERWALQESAKPPQPREGARPAASVPGFSKTPIFVWTVCVQLLAFGWLWAGLGVLEGAPLSGEVVLKALNKMLSLPGPALLFGLMPILLLFVPGTLLGNWMLEEARPGAAVGLGAGALLLGGVYLASGLICFLVPAAAMGLQLAGWKRSLKSMPSLAVLGFAGLIWWWPFELLSSLLRLKKQNSHSWLSKTGTPFALFLVSGLMIRNQWSLRTSLRSAPACFPKAAQEPGAEFWGRFFYQAPVLAWFLGSPAIFAVSFLPAIKMGLRPTEIFDVWYVSNGQFVAFFGYWAGFILSLVGLGGLMMSGALRAAGMLCESH